jgi:hypothetical protein
MLRIKALFDGIEYRGPDVSVNDPQSTKGHPKKTLSVMPMVTNPVWGISHLA